MLKDNTAKTHYFKTNTLGQRYTSTKVPLKISVISGQNATLRLKALT